MRQAQACAAFQREFGTTACRTETLPCHKRLHPSCWTAVKPNVYAVLLSCPCRVSKSSRRQVTCNWHALQPKHTTAKAVQAPEASPAMAATLASQRLTNELITHQALFRTFRQRSLPLCRLVSRFYIAITRIAAGCLGSFELQAVSLEANKQASSKHEGQTAQSPDFATDVPSWPRTSASVCCWSVRTVPVRPSTEAALSTDIIFSSFTSVKMSGESSNPLQTVQNCVTCQSLR